MFTPSLLNYTWCQIDHSHNNAIFSSTVYFHVLNYVIKKFSNIFYTIILFIRIARLKFSKLEESYRDDAEPQKPSIFLQLKFFKFTGFLLINDDIIPKERNLLTFCFNNKYRVPSFLLTFETTSRENIHILTIKLKNLVALLLIFKSH